jgi:phage terminase small subunit
MKDFADFYLETGNIYQSAIKAGYSENYAKTNASKLLEKDSVKNYIEGQLAEIQSQRIATITEVMEYLTKGLRQELEEEVVVATEVGVQIVTKKIGIKDSNKCVEMLAKRFGILSEKVNLTSAIPVVIVDDIDEE